MSARIATRAELAAYRRAMRSRWPHTIMGAPCDLKVEVRRADGSRETVYDSASAREVGARALARALRPLRGLIG